MKKKLPKSNRMHLKKKTMAITMMALPGIICLILFNYMPMFGLILSFKNFRYDLGFLRSPWCGFDNFKYYFTSQDVWRTTRNTIGYNLVFIVSVTVTALVLAMLLNEIRSKTAVKVYQTTMFFPYYLSFSVVAYIGYSFMSTDYGVLNRILNMFGMESISWYSEPKAWPFILPAIHLWKIVGHSVILYYAAIISIDSSIYESAEIDGATGFQKAVKITLPLISPIIIVLTILSIGKIFHSDFGLFYLVPYGSGILQSTTDVIDTYVYRSITQIGNIGASTAVGLYQSVVGLFLVMASNIIVKRIDKESAIF